MAGKAKPASGNRKQACRRVVWTLRDGSQIGNATVLSPSHVPLRHSSPGTPLACANANVRTLNTDTGVTQVTQTLTPRLTVQALFPPGHTELHTHPGAHVRDTPVSASIPTHRLLCPPNGPVGSVASHGRPGAPCPGPSLCRHPFGPGIFILQSVCSVSTVDCRPRSNHCPCSASFPRNRASGVVGAWRLAAHPSPYSWGSGRNSRKGRVD